MMIVFLLVTGRAPNTKRLNLEAVGVELDERTGAVKVSSYLLNILVIVGPYFFFSENSQI